jgi:hypothetical protein
MCAPSSAFCVLFVCKCVLFVFKCVLYYCHRLSTQLQLNNNNNNNNNNKVIIKCTVHYIVHLQCTFSLSLVRMKVRDSDILARVRGQRKTSQVLGAFGLLDFTMLRPVLAWGAF